MRRGARKRDEAGGSRLLLSTSGEVSDRKAAGQRLVDVHGVVVTSRVCGGVRTPTGPIALQVQRLCNSASVAGDPPRLGQRQLLPVWSSACEAYSAAIDAGTLEAVARQPTLDLLIVPERTPRVQLDRSRTPAPYDMVTEAFDDPPEEA